MLKLRLNSKSKTLMVIGICRPPEGDTKIFKNYGKDIKKKESASSKTFFMVIFQNEFLPLIQRET